MSPPRPSASGGASDPRIVEPLGHGAQVRSSQALADEVSSLRQTISLFDRLTGMTLAGASVGEVTAELGASLHEPVAVLDPLLELVAVSQGGSPGGAGVDGAEVALDALGWDLGEPRLRQAFEAVALNHLPLVVPGPPELPMRGGCVLAPICAGEELLGFLAVARSPDSESEDLALLSVQHAASIYALVLLQEHRDAEIQARYKRELVEALFLGHASQSRAVELAVLAGLVPDIPYWVVAICVLSSRDRAVPALSTLARLLDGEGPGFVAIERHDHVSVLVPCPDQEQLVAEGGPVRAELARYEARLTEVLSERYPGASFAIGASSLATGPSALASADEQARRALEVVRRLGAAGAITSYDDLGIHRLLLHVPSEELRRFSDDVLATLVAYDRAHHSSLVETLATYLRNGENLRRTAEEMILHVNTASYRVRRIEEISGLRLALPEHRLLARVALEIWRTEASR